MMEDKIQETLSGLKDFQLKTVDYVYTQLYVNGRNKMLVADEVGLGKTIIAKGIIVKAFSQFTPTPAKSKFNVIYVCSNQALARQNLQKLNFSGDHGAIDFSEDDDRLTALAYVGIHEERSIPFRIKAFTPATSFDDKTHAGKADERILLYRLLYRYADLNPHKNSLKWILKGNKRISDENWEHKIKCAESFDTASNTFGLKGIRPKVFSEFRKILEKVVTPVELPKCFKAACLTYPVKYWTLLKNLCDLDVRKNNYNSEGKDFCKELISSLRFLLSNVCLEFLQADIFILDEFQRYKRLIENPADKEEDEKSVITPAIQLVREIFSFEKSKILLLSATPFKPYTTGWDELNGEVHYGEFTTVLKFLMADRAPRFWEDYERDRRALYNFLRHPDTIEENIEEGIRLKNRLEKLYRTCIVRTEKLIAANDKDALIKSVNNPITVQPEDIQDFVVLDQITLHLNKEHKTSLGVPLEYVKSCPYALSFLDRYQHKEKIRSYLKDDHVLRTLLKKTKHGWVDLKNIRNYKALIPAKGKVLPNGKLRLLLHETVQNNGWKYLWIPPSIPYYDLAGAFTLSWGYSKSLIFSSWKMVPKMVSSLVSYEAERLSVGNPRAVSEMEKREKENYQPYYFQKRRSPRPQFTFRVQKEEQEPQQMNSFSLLYPSLFLTKFYDPAINVAEKKSIKKIKNGLKNEFIKVFNNLDLNQYANGEGDWKKWYWLAPVLLDKCSGYSREMESWLLKGMPPSELFIDSENIENEREEGVGKKIHFEFARKAFLDTKTFQVGKLSSGNLEMICEHLAELTIGSPAVCFLRSQTRHYDFSIDLLDASYNVASAFLTMFNKPESIAIVRIFSEEGDYWEKTLKYMIDGNIQAMLDEFVYLLINGEGIRQAAELSNFISDLLSIRTVNSEIDDYNSFMENNSLEKPKKRLMRAHYAVDFGMQKINTTKGAGRQINIRQAFNSPFRPFVLASTSIGQEGLDFHLYCKKIFHWNLPSNPIDFEQREGRIHRYQGLVIRLNLADKYARELHSIENGDDVWGELFKYAKKEKTSAKFPCDLVPFWHTDTKSDIRIERHVPLYPFSRDNEKFRNLIKVLTYYRLTFGQPRQEELIEAFHKSNFSQEMLFKMEKLIINLSPIQFLNEAPTAKT